MNKLDGWTISSVTEEKKANNDRIKYIQALNKEHLIEELVKNRSEQHH